MPKRWNHRRFEKKRSLWQTKRKTQKERRASKKKSKKTIIKSRADALFFYYKISKWSVFFLVILSMIIFWNSTKVQTVFCCLWRVENQFFQFVFSFSTKSRIIFIICLCICVLMDIFHVDKVEKSVMFVRFFHVFFWNCRSFSKFSLCLLQLFMFKFAGIC